MSERAWNTGTLAEYRRKRRLQDREELRIAIEDRWSYQFTHGGSYSHSEAKTHPMDCECGPCLSLALYHVRSWADDRLLVSLCGLPVPGVDTPERAYLSRLIIKTCFARTDVRGARERLHAALYDWDHHQLVVPPPVVTPARMRRIQPPARSLS
jgi:hypothetical protein